jgi:hypothetical protein
MSNSSKIIKVRTNDLGNVAEVLLENGDVVPINHAILMAKDGLIENVIVARGEHGGEYIRTDPNLTNHISNNLSSLPRF